MDVSSRTPEGSPNTCPVCGKQVVIEPTRPPGDAPCPHCGTLLWFFPDAEECYFYEAKEIAPIRSEVDALIDFMNASPDSLDIVELVMNLEEEFDITIPEADAQQIQSVRDALRYLLGIR